MLTSRCVAGGLALSCYDTAEFDTGMVETPRTAPLRLRFGVFELDLHSGELRKAGARVRLTGQPLKILVRLLGHPGDLVTREELRSELWSDDTFVDFERNLNSSIKRLRAALGDSADAPRFIETLPRRGYRFLIPVEAVREPVEVRESDVHRTHAAPTELESRLEQGAGVTTARSGDTRIRRSLTASLMLALFGVGAILYSFLLARDRPRSFQSIAVLPFVVANPDSAEDEYLAFGMVEGLITEMSRFEGIRVISQASTMRYKGAAKGLPQIARELDVDAVVTGSVIREGSRIQITVQLIDAADDSHLWAETYRREIGSVLSFVNDVAPAVAREVHVKISPTVARAAPAPAADGRVAEAYLKGRYHLAKASAADFLRARTYFNEALAIDASHAPSHSGLADSYILDETFPPAMTVNARLHTRRALELDEALPDAHASLAFLKFYGDWDWAGAGRAFKRALELSSGHVRTHRRYAVFLAAMGRHAQARDEIQQALALDPISIMNHDAAAVVRFNARQYADSIAVGRTILDLDAFDARGYEHLTVGMIQTGQYDLALEQVDRALSLSGSTPQFQCLRAMVLGRLGRTAEAQRIMDGLDREAGRRYVSSVLRAVAHADLGQHERALNLLDRAFEERDAHLVLIHVSPWFDPLRGSARFEHLHDRLKFPG